MGLGPHSAGRPGLVCGVCGFRPPQTGSLSVSRRGEAGRDLGHEPGSRPSLGGGEFLPWRRMVRRGGVQGPHGLARSNDGRAGHAPGWDHRLDEPAPVPAARLSENVPSSGSSLQPIVWAVPDALSVFGSKVASIVTWPLHG